MYMHLHVYIYTRGQAFFRKFYKKKKIHYQSVLQIQKNVLHLYMDTMLCSVLQCVAVCCSVLQHHTATYCTTRNTLHHTQHTAPHCTTLMEIKSCLIRIHTHVHIQMYSYLAQTSFVITSSDCEWVCTYVNNFRDPYITTSPFTSTYIKHTQQMLRIPPVNPQTRW